MGQETKGDSARPIALAREFYFPTPIYYADLPEARSLNEAIKPRIYAWRTEDQEGIHRSNVKRVGSWHSQLNMHCREEYRRLTEQILVATRKIFDDLGYDPAYEPAIDNMWVNINPRYGYNRTHIHPNVLWSGVYYVQAPPDCGRIYFTDPRAQVLILTPRYAPAVPRKAEAWSEVYYEAIEGRLILFPSWLAHEVEPNLCNLEGSDGDRISISFNLYQRGRQSG